MIRVVRLSVTIMEGSRMWTDPPPPIPATARAAMRASIEGAIPQNIVPDPVE